MTKTGTRRASALVFAIWTIAVLSVMALSFAYEAKQQAGINIYVQRRNRVTHLLDAGKILAEIVLTGYKDAPDWSEDQDLDKLLEDDAWIKEKQELKTDSRCTIGPVMLDEENPETSLVTVEIEASNSGSRGIININNLYKGSDGTSDPKYTERWWMIFRAHNIPEELDTPKDGTIDLWNVLIASWNDWRDEDDSVTQIDGKDCGAENEWYEDLENDFKNVDDDTKNELKRRPRQGPIPDIKELEYVRGFRDYPAVLTGGVINPWEADEKDRISVKGILDLFCTDGPNTININNCNSIDALITVPGIYEDPSDDECVAEATEVAQALLDALRQMPEDYDVDETRSFWPFKDWSDMTSRLNDSGGRVSSDDIGGDAQSYFSFALDDTTVFRVKITGESSGMSRSVEAECYVKDSGVRYIKWTEN